MAKNEWDELNQSVMNIKIESLRKARKPSIVSELKKVKTRNGWLAFCKKYNLNPTWDISHRGGTLGVYASGFIANVLGSRYDASLFPSKIGVYCNYLGGGLRGSINEGGYKYEAVKDKDARIISAFYNACKTAYLSIEQEGDGDGEPSIPDDAIGTGIGRVNVKSAY